MNEQLTQAEKNQMLCDAVYNNIPEMAEQAIALGAETNIKDELGEPLLMRALIFKHWDVAALLIDNNADVNAPDKELNTPLMLAAKEGWHNICEKLLDKEANIDAKNKKGRTALIEASAEQPHVARMLIWRKADVHAEDVDGNTALTASVSQRSEEIYSELISKEAKFPASFVTQENLFLAVSRRHVNICEKLLELSKISKTIDVNARDNSDANSRNNNETALHKAAKMGYGDVCRVLINHGADKETLNQSGKTPLLLATQCAGNCSASLELIKAGANAHACANNTTTLLNAARNKQAATCLKLLEKKVNPHALDEYGMSALLHATDCGMGDVAMKLLEQNVDIHLRSEEGNSALIYAIGRKLEDVAVKLIDMGVNIETPGHFDDPPIMLATHYSQLKVCRKLVEKNVNLAVENEDGSNPLMLAIKKGRALNPRTHEFEQGNLELIRLYLQQGLKPPENRKDILSELLKTMEHDLSLKREDCLKDGRLTDEVLDTLALGNFDTKIASPLSNSGNPDDLHLLKEIWKEMPERFRHENKAIYVSMIKSAGNALPAPGLDESQERVAE